MRTKQRGSTVLIATLAILVVATFVSVGWYVWHKQKRSNVTAQKTTQQPIASTTKMENITTTKPSNLFTLDKGKVRFIIPESWTADEKYVNSVCRSFVTDESTQCIEGVALYPNSKPRTRYGDGSEFFYVHASVYKNPNKSDAKTWLETDFHDGAGSATIIDSSFVSSNGRSTYYLKHDSGYQEVKYIDAFKDKVVYLYARTYEPATLANGTQVGNFKDYEPQIKELAKSITFN